MPSKLAVQVIYCSGEEENFSAAELVHHNPASKGWQSPKFADFPLEIGLRLAGEAHVQQMQFLSHESKIATKIEVFVCEPSAESRRTRQFPPYENAQWRRLGYLSLSPNEQSEYLARELKTVHVSCHAVYVRLLVHKCHVNSFNFFNQVGLVAVNVVGDLTQLYGTGAPTPYELQVRALLPSAEGGPEVPLKDMKPPTVSAEEYSNVRYEFQYDPVTMKRLRELSVMKQRAVAEEDYDTAKRLKEQVDALKQVGTRLMQLENQKKAAVASEDYDLAKALKNEVDKLRAQAMGFGRPGSREENRHPPPQHLPPMGAFQGPGGGGGGAAQQGAEAIGGVPLPPLRSTGSPSPHSPAGPSSVGASAPVLVPHPPPRAPEGASVPQQAAAAAAATDFDERPAISRALAEHAPQLPPDTASGDVSPAAPTVYRRDIDEVLNDPDPFNTGRAAPAQRAAEAAEEAGFDIRKQPEWEQDVHARVVALHAEAQHVPALPEAKAREHAEFGTHFGEFALRCLFARQWHARDAAVKGIAGKLAAGGADVHPFPGDRRFLITLLLKYLTLRGCGFNDPISGVFTSSGEALCILLAGEMPASAHASLQLVAAALLPKVAEVHPRTKEQAVELLMTLANSPAAGAERVAACVLAEPEKKRGEREAQIWRMLNARAVIVALMLDKFGLSRPDRKTGLTAESVMQKIVVPCLNSSQEEVRKQGVKICGILHRAGAGKHVERHTQMMKKALKDAIAKECGGGDDPHEREMMNSSISVDGGESAKRQQRAARSAARQAQEPQQKRQGYSPLKGQAPAAAPAAGAAAAATIPVGAGGPDDDETVCQFCGKRDPRFTDQVLDLHYLHSCPALYQCQLCEQVIEIMMLTEHWVQECEKKAMKQCTRCREAIPVADFAAHSSAKSCAPHNPQVAVCVLCKARFPSGEEAWEQHLLRDGCPKNPRGKGEKEGAEFQLAAQMAAQPKA
eukprot:TRINITY_DN1944_c2_g7_i1.p1 TRINITY_DN1944_c2_g7~~TRINITY_DN1944_c2_g7_i1.p1  ORF type:complete len:965 (+),score=328.19 TRINITY_DN1944_c2_g7_i1:151-3045(+)